MQQLELTESDLKKQTTFSIIYKGPQYFNKQSQWDVSSSYYALGEHSSICEIIGNQTGKDEAWKGRCPVSLKSHVPWTPTSLVSHVEYAGMNYTQLLPRKDWLQQTTIPVITAGAKNMLRGCSQPNGNARSVQTAMENLSGTST